MSEKKIAVVFPGMGYHTDKPLLYYSKRIARSMGYEIVELKYDFPYKAREIMNDKARMKEAFEIAVSQIREQVKGIQFDEYNDILFIGKSIGTAVAVHYAAEHRLKPFQLMYTPLPETFYLAGEDGISQISGVAFHGTADPWADTETLAALADRFKVPLHLTEGGNHSLETGDALTDLKTLLKVMRYSEEVIR